MLANPDKVTVAEAARVWCDGADPDPATEFSDGMQDETAPLYLLGRNFLTEAVWAVAGDDPLSEVLPLLERRLNAVLTALDPAPGFTGTALAKSLICALPYDFEFNQPEEIEFLECLGCEGCTGHPLLDFVDEGIAPDLALRGGVAAIAAVADLCRTDAESVLDVSAETREP
jgi:hypothetical protein